MVKYLYCFFSQIFFLIVIFTLDWSFIRNADATTNLTVAAVNMNLSASEPFAKTSVLLYKASDSSVIKKGLSSQKDLDNKSNNRTIVSNQVANEVNKFSEMEIMQKEINNLHKQLDSLNKKQQQLESQNQELKLGLQSYKITVDSKKEYDKHLEGLINDINASEAHLNKTQAPPNYIVAINLVLAKNLDMAYKSFYDLLETLKQSNSNASIYTGDKKYKKAKYISMASYWLGRIDYLNKNYNQSTKDFSDSYQYSSSHAISLKSLVYIASNFTKLKNHTNACLAIKQFNNDLSNIKKEQANFIIDSKYIQLIDTYNKINQCQ